MPKESEIEKRKGEIEIERLLNGTVAITTIKVTTKETREVFKNLNNAKRAKDLESGFWGFSTLGIAGVGIGSFFGGLVQLSKGIAEGDEVQSLGSAIAVIGGAVIGGAAIVNFANRLGNKAELAMEQANRVKEFIKGSVGRNFGTKSYLEEKSEE